MLTSKVFVSEHLMSAGAHEKHNICAGNLITYCFATTIFSGIIIAAFAGLFVRIVLIYGCHQWGSAVKERTLN